MTDTLQALPPAEKPARKPAKRRKKAKRKPAVNHQDLPGNVIAAAPKAWVGDMTGLTATSCPVACTNERCVISTVAICKHPLKSPDAGCGPVTMVNRARALKMIKRQKIEAS